MKQQTVPFSSYQKLAITLLALTQFSVILDFMIMSPLGDLLMKSMHLKPNQFSIVVSAYAFSAGISGLLTAGFADRFDRKKLLLFFYCGFILGTLCCGLAHTYVMLVAARIVTGLFGGVIGSISMAIITDLFKLEQRGRAMGFIQMGFGASQVLGIPISLYFADTWGWEAPFLMVVGLATVIALVILIKMKPVTAHLAIQHDKTALTHLWHTFKKRNYRIGFLATALLSIGGFMMMPFGSAFAVNNLHIRQEDLMWLFMASGLGSLVIMPIAGKLSDRMDKFKLFSYCSLFLMVMVVVYTNLTPAPFAIIVILNILMMAGVLGRMVPATTLTSAVPDMADRGAFMSINASLQQIAGGVAAAIAGLIVVKETETSPLKHYDIVGYVMVVLTIPCIYMVYRVSKLVRDKMNKKAPAEAPAMMEA
ncbi:MAG: MFS transporter [Filimonas sp.]|nr:MFS transporter [Filimonas sp.]